MRSTLAAPQSIRGGALHMRWRMLDRYRVPIYADSQTPSPRQDGIMTMNDIKRCRRTWNKSFAR